jgi:sugar O-acyltransferase (sialic acid O-acetyltransferase NeuD family)
MIYLYGAGGHAKVIADILEVSGVKMAGVFDKDLSKKFWNYKVIDFPGPFDFITDEMIISIGNNATRKKLAEQTKAKYYTAIHKRSVVSKYASIGEGSVVMGGVLINADTTIGKHCIINSQASIDHDCQIDDFVHISPNATLCGGIALGECVQIGAGAVIIPGKKIGANSIIGAGAIVIADIPANVIAVGNPACIVKHL